MVWRWSVSHVLMGIRLQMIIKDVKMVASQATVQPVSLHTTTSAEFAIKDIMQIKFGYVFNVLCLIVNHVLTKLVSNVKSVTNFNRMVLLVYSMSVLVI